MITVKRGTETFRDVYAALCADRAAPIKLYVSGKPANLEQMQAARSMAQATPGRGRAEYALIAFVNAQEAAREQGPTPCGQFEMPLFPDTVDGLDARELLAGLNAATLFLSTDTHYPELEISAQDIRLRDSVMVFTWDEASGFDAHCHGVRQVSVRPYRVSDKCDGTREDAALYTLFYFMRVLGMSFEEGCQLHRDAYAGHGSEESREFQVPLVWYSEYWRMHVVEAVPLTPCTFRKLMESLYDMNYRSLAAQAEAVMLPRLLQPRARRAAVTASTCPPAGAAL